MKKIICDVCGGEMDARDPRNHLAGTKAAEPGLLGQLLLDRDVCPACMQTGRGLDIGEIIMNAWKERVR